LQGWILAVANRHNPISRIDVIPLNVANFFLSHRRCDSKANNARHGEYLPWLPLEETDEVIEFALSGPPIPFVRLADKAKRGKRYGQQCRKMFFTFFASTTRGTNPRSPTSKRTTDREQVIRHFAPRAVPVTFSY